MLAEARKRSGSSATAPIYSGRAIRLRPDLAIHGIGESADDAGMEVEAHLLMARCPECREPFASALQMDPDTWSGMSIHRGLVERCPHCHASSMFMKRDYYFESN